MKIISFFNFQCLCFLLVSCNFAAFFFIFCNRLSALIILIVGVTVDLLLILVLLLVLLIMLLNAVEELFPFELPRPLSPFPLFECEVDDPLELAFDPLLLEELTLDVTDEDILLLLPVLLADDEVLLIDGGVIDMDVCSKFEAIFGLTDDDDDLW